MKVSIERTDNDGFIVIQEGKDKFKYVVLEEDIISSLQETINLTIEILGFIVEAPENTENSVGFKLNKEIKDKK